MKYAFALIGLVYATACNAQTPQQWQNWVIQQQQQAAQQQYLMEEQAAQQRMFQQQLLKQQNELEWQLRLQRDEQQ
jgi:CRISPR/Cas system endoribonuclease Cas6 (RAMP superfamily)